MPLQLKALAIFGVTGGVFLLLPGTHYLALAAVTAVWTFVEVFCQARREHAPNVAAFIWAFVFMLIFGALWPSLPLAFAWSDIRGDFIGVYTDDDEDDSP